MQQSSYHLGIRLTFAALGVFGATLAITGILLALPLPAAGGTCGPGKGSEAPILALLNPASIGAGKEPAASNATSHDQWLAFVGECQASADGRALAAIGILALSVGIALVGPWLVFKRKNREQSVSS